MTRLKTPDGDTIYWDCFLQCRVTLGMATPDGHVSVQLLDPPGVQLEHWNGITPAPGSQLISSWEAISPYRPN